MFLPSKDRSTINVIDGHTYNLTFGAYCRALELYQDGNSLGASICLGCKNPLDINELELVWEEIHKTRWLAPSKDYKSLGLDDETITELLNAERDFDVLLDFDAYAPDFLKLYGIDLYDNDINLFKFFDLLFALMSDSTTSISKRIAVRNYSHEQGAGVTYNVEMQQRKEQYSLQ